PSAGWSSRTSSKFVKPWLKSSTALPSFWPNRSKSSVVRVQSSRMKTTKLGFAARYASETLIASRKTSQSRVVWHVEALKTGALVSELPAQVTCVVASSSVPDGGEAAPRNVKGVATS